MSKVGRNKNTTQDRHSAGAPDAAGAGSRNSGSSGEQASISGGTGAACGNNICVGEDAKPFWTCKRLDQMTGEEWEQLCDRCGRCCLMKLEDEETGRIYATDVGCRLLDAQTCTCTSYENRHDIVTDCVQISAEIVSDLTWLPPTCAYRLVDEGRDLYWWHPLVSGEESSVVAAGISVKGRVFKEELVPVEALEDHIANWPFQDYSGTDRDDLE